MTLKPDLFIFVQRVCLGQHLPWYGYRPPDIGWAMPKPREHVLRREPIQYLSVTDPCDRGSNSSSLGNNGHGHVGAHLGHWKSARTSTGNTIQPTLGIPPCSAEAGVSPHSPWAHWREATTRANRPLT